MHSDQCTADIDSCSCLHADTVGKHRALHSPVTDRCERAARMIRLGDGIDLLKAIFLQYFFLDYKRPVQMFAALPRQKNASFLQNGGNAIVDRFRCIHIRGCSDPAADHFTR